MNMYATNSSCNGEPAFHNSVKASELTYTGYRVLAAIKAAIQHHCLLSLDNNDV